MEPNESKQKTGADQNPGGKKETPTKQKRERNYKTIQGESPEQTKARKDNERQIKKDNFYKDRSARANEIKEDLKQTLILKKHLDNSFKGQRYSDERKTVIFNAVIDEMETGESLTNSLIKFRVDAATFYNWIDNDVNLFKRYARAHTKRADSLFDKMVDVAVNMPDVNRARLVNDTIKYVCARISPEKYSEKQTINIIGNVNQNITTLAPEDRDKKILELMQKAGSIIDINPE